MADTWDHYQQLLQAGVPAREALAEALSPGALPTPERPLEARESKRRASRIKKLNRKAARGSR